MRRCHQAKPLIFKGNTMKKQTTIPFMGNQLILLNHESKPFVAIRPIVINMGLDWSSQCAKIRSNAQHDGLYLHVMGEDGKTHRMLCLPLNNLNDYLLSINPKKFKCGIHNKIIRYQEECLNALLNADWLNQQYKILDELTEYFNQLKISFDKFVEEQKRDEKEFDTLMEKGKELLAEAKNYPDIPTKENIHHA